MKRTNQKGMWLLLLPALAVLCSGLIPLTGVQAKIPSTPESVVIDKFVGEAGDTDYPFDDYDASKYKPVAANTPFGWSILSSLPPSLGTAAKETYTVTDEMKECFDYVPGTVKVYAVLAKNTLVAGAYRLTEGTDYTQTYDSTTRRLVIELTPAGITHLKTRYSSNQDRYVLIKYDCRLNNTADQGVRIYSGATVEHTRNAVSSASAKDSSGTGAVNLSSGSWITKESTSLSTVTTKSVETGQVSVAPAVHTGQIGITKLEDGVNKPLKNAEFGLAATEADAKAGNFLATGKTDSNGKLSFPGLLYGVPGDSPYENTGDMAYWLVETKAPDGYQLVKEPVKVTFHYQEDGNGSAYCFAELEVYNVADGTGKPATEENPGDETGTGSKKGSAKRLLGAIRTGDTRLLYPVLAVMVLSLAAMAVLLVRSRKQASKE